MYYPYFRGKQFELILIRDNAKFLADNNIHPIIEPVKNDFKALNRALKLLNEQHVSCTLIINPQVGNEPIKTEKILSKIVNDSIKEYKNVSIGYILNAETDIADLVSSLKNYGMFNFSILHYGYTKGREVSEAIEDFTNIKRHVFIDGYAGKLYQNTESSLKA